MALIIENNILEHIPLDIQSALSKMSADHQKIFQSKFIEGRKTTAPMLLLAIFFPI